MSFKIYTKTGDKGTTALWGGGRLPKYHLRIEAYGSLDELNANLGLLRDFCEQEEQRQQLLKIQERLFSLGTIMATAPEKADKVKQPDVLPEDVLQLENWMDAMDEHLAPLKNFVLPGGHPQVSRANIARTVCRRAERLAVALNEEQALPAVVLQYLNRLSDYLFIFGRFAAHCHQAEEVLWKSRG